jgi:polyphenol oxidase
VIETPLGGPVPRYELARWREEFGILAGITVRGDPACPFDLGLGGQAPIGEVLDRWNALRLAVPGFRGIVVSRQVHGTAVLWHSDIRGISIHQGADGHATDCIPVYLADPVRRFVALLHAGWRGVAAGILSAGLAAMRVRGSIVDNVLVHCGIGICGQCYEVGPEVFGGCGLVPPAGSRGPLDLRAVLLEQARALGVENVSTSPYCSKHDGGFFSHRGGTEARMAAYLGMVP